MLVDIIATLEMRTNKLIDNFLSGYYAVSNGGNTIKYFIPIDWSTVKTNLNAGATFTPVCMGPPSIEQIGYYRLSDSSWVEIVYRGTRINMELLNEVKQLNWPDAVPCVLEDGVEISRKVVTYAKSTFKPELTIQENFNVEYVRHRPISKYNYRYKSTEVLCNECGEKFMHDELMVLDLEDGWSDRICPKCGAWDCCELEFETLSRV